jgi:hypothetical protein
MSRLAFVGLGAMGSRLARRLLAAGHAVTGWNRTADKARDLVGAGLALATSPRAAAEGAEGVFTMVTDDAALRAVTLGPDGLVAGLAPGATLLEMSTVSPSVVRELESPVTVRCSTSRSPAAPSRSSRARRRSSSAATPPRWSGRSPGCWRWAQRSHTSGPWVSPRR